MIKSKSDWNKEEADRYVRYGYTRCPICGSDNISGRSVQIDGNDAWQDVSCFECEAEWEDLYQLMGVTIVSFGKLESEVSLGGN